MKLIYTATGQEVKVGDVIDYVHHNAPEGTKPVKRMIESIEVPRRVGSTGRVYAKAKGDKYTNGVFPSVYDMEWVERTDQ